MNKAKEVHISIGDLETGTVIHDEWYNMDKKEDQLDLANLLAPPPPDPDAPPPPPPPPDPDNGPVAILDPTFIDPAPPRGDVIPAPT